mgnify:CR=1 FL=1
MKKKKRKKNLLKGTTKTNSHSKTILLSEYIKIININNKKKLSRESEPSLK